MGLWQVRARHGRVVIELGHEAGVDPVLHPPQPRPATAQPELVGKSDLVAHRDQLEVVTLRGISAQGAARGGGAQVVEQDRRLAHRKNPGLGAWRKGQMGAIPCRKDRRIRGLQSGRHRDKSLVQTKSSAFKPALRPRPGHRQGKIRGKLAAVRQADLACAKGRCSHIGAQGYPGLVHGVCQAARCARGHATQRDRPAFKHGNRRRAARHAQPMRRRKRQFHTADTRPDNGQSGMRGRLGDKSLPTLGIGTQRLGGGCMIGKALNIWKIGRDADINRGGVIAHGTTRGQDDMARVAVDRGCVVKDQPRPGKSRKTYQIDHQISVRIVTGNRPGQHPRVGCHRAGVDHRQPRPGQRVHPPHPQHKGMRMPSADQHNVMGHGKRRLHRRSSLWPEGVKRDRTLAAWPQECEGAWPVRRALRALVACLWRTAP